MEASSLTRASRRGLLARRSPLLRLERDERLVALIRAGNESAFDVLFRRYHQRLHAFCTSMLKSPQDAEDVLQEVFANAHKAILADERTIKVRPWLYRIARNRCLNHLRKPVPEGQDSMDVHVHENGATTAERVQDREELRSVIADVGTLPETQRGALLLREIDQLSYEEIAQAMETTIPAVKSLLVRARISLAESSQARQLTCDEVRVELAEAAEGLAKASGPVRQHMRGCEPCREFRDQLRSDRKQLASLISVGPLALLGHGLLAKLLGVGSSSGAAGTAAGTAIAGGAGGATACGATAGGLSALGTKAAAGVATAALITAGAVEVSRSPKGPATPPPATERAVVAPAEEEQPKRLARHKPRDPEPAAAPAPDPAAEEQADVAEAEKEKGGDAEQSADETKASKEEPIAGSSGQDPDAPADPAEGEADPAEGEEVGDEDGAGAGKGGQGGSDGGSTGGLPVPLP